MKENENVYYKARLWFDEADELHGISVCNRRLPMGLMEALNTKMHEVVNTVNGKLDWRRTFYNFIHCGIEYIQYIPDAYKPDYPMCEHCCFWDEEGKACLHPHYLNGGKGRCYYPYRKVDKDLTWQDIKRIVKIADHIVTQETGKYGNEEEYYKEVLKRYKEVNKCSRK